MYLFDAKDADYELITLFDIPMLFSLGRIDRKTVPEGLYAYDVRNDDYQEGLPVELCPFVFVNHWGTVLSKVKIDMIKETITTVYNDKQDRYYRMIDPEDDWNYEGYSLSLDDYLKMKIKKAVNIIWDTDRENIKLPNEIMIPVEITDEDEISDYITNATGFCHKGFEIITLQ